MAPKRKRADDDKNPFDDPPPRGQGILKLTANEFAVARGPCFGGGVSTSSSNISSQEFRHGNAKEEGVTSW